MKGARQMTKTLYLLKHWPDVEAQKMKILENLILRYQYCLMISLPNKVFCEAVAHYMDIFGQHPQNKHFSSDPKLKPFFW